VNLKNNDMKKAAERITRGKGNFINCTDYDDAVKAINDAVAETRSEMMEFAEWIKEDVDSDFYMGILQWKVYLSATRHLWFQTTNELLSYWLTNIKGK